MSSSTWVRRKHQANPDDVPTSAPRWPRSPFSSVFWFRSFSPLARASWGFRAAELAAWGLLWAHSNAQCPCRSGASLCLSKPALHPSSAFSSHKLFSDPQANRQPLLQFCSLEIRPQDGVKSSCPDSSGWFIDYESNFSEVWKDTQHCLFFLWNTSTTVMVYGEEVILYRFQVSGIISAVNLLKMHWEMG